jgi:hypothetical protein
LSLDSDRQQEMGHCTKASDLISEFPFVYVHFPNCLTTTTCPFSSMALHVDPKESLPIQTSIVNQIILIIRYENIELLYFHKPNALSGKKVAILVS